VDRRAGMVVRGGEVVINKGDAKAVMFDSLNHFARDFECDEYWIEFSEIPDAGFFRFSFRWRRKNEGEICHVKKQFFWSEIESMSHARELALCLAGDVLTYFAKETTSKRRQPSLEELYRMAYDGVCTATDGCLVEPDGLCEHGHLSWLRQLGLI